MALLPIGGKIFDTSSLPELQYGSEDLKSHIKRELGIKRQEKILKAKLQSVTQPEVYLKNRAKAVDDVIDELATTYQDTYENLYNLGYQNDVALDYANDVMNAFAKVRLRVINETWPIESVEGGLNVAANKLLSSASPNPNLLAAGNNVANAAPTK